MSEPSELQQIQSDLKRIAERIEVPKRKEWSDHVLTITPFLSTVLVALFSLYVSHSEKAQSAQRQAALDSAQRSVQRAEVRIEALKALTTFAPLLASEDSAQREVARIILDAIQQTESVPGAAPLATAIQSKASGLMPTIKADSHRTTRSGQSPR